MANFRDYENTQNSIVAGFGGRCEHRDRSVCTSKTCLLREMAEESKNLLNEIVDKAWNDKERRTIFEGVNGKDVIYFVFVLLDYEDVQDIPEIFRQMPEGKEKLGNLGFYRQSDIRKRKVRTSSNLTDFISYLNRNESYL
jgi:uncharacterized protein (DUF1015 family)